ncbi:hypothetical protein WKH27_07105 [Pantoea agglomerans]|uniref:hypothetical protein n=1 Tax=Enterobacter agglomerans TaxID=549 RepID=UPI0013795C7F|nr:hypothetical protein [Pantoea agglomerans]WNK33772.1 hypothetical protein RM158_11790 [Pantoea agglomerans]WNK52020.1 hypothetical protein RM154_11485 [Pantoea agglomerans]WNK70015.1 hypothetical protein RM155_11610 [Pantoea agglomerans]
MPQVRHPRVFGDKDVTPLELFSKTHPDYGAGNIQQIYADNRIINFDKVDILPERE